MTHGRLVWGLGVIAALLPLSAASQEATGREGAPAGTSETRYCMRIEAVTGTLLEQVRCWTREQWAEQGVDVDRDWAEEGVRTID